MKDYRVTCETKKGGLQHWAIDVSASNAKEARACLLYTSRQENSGWSLRESQVV